MYYGEWQCCNYRTFYGETNIPLCSGYKEKEIVLIRGNNGAGKTTFINGIKLALYGSNAGLNKNVEYKQYLKENINDKAKNEGITSAWVAIEFKEKLKSDKEMETKTILIKREWNLVTDTEVEEYVSIYENGQEVDIENGMDEYLDKIIPKEILNFFAFDAEEIRYTADDLNSGDNITADISRILGITEIEVSKNALKTYKSKQRKESLNNSIDDRIIQSQLRIQKFKSNINENKNYVQELKEENDELESKIYKKKKWLEERGFLNSNKREESEKRIAELIEKRNQIYNFYEYLKPGEFSYVLILSEIKQLSNQLKYEDVSSNKKELQNTSNLIKDKILSRLDDITTCPELTQIQLDDLKTMIKNIWIDLYSTDKDGPVILHKNSLSKFEFDELNENLLRYIYDLEDATERVKNQMNNLDEIELELKNENSSVRKLPSSDQIKQLIDEIDILDNKTQDINKEMEEFSIKININQESIASEETVLRKLSLELKEKNVMLAKMELCETVITILHSYTINLKKQKAKEIRIYLTDMYKSLANKQGMVQEFIIDEKTFEISIIGRYRQILAKRGLSEGEKQIYGLSLTYALAKSSKKELGFIIDTPFAKLDSVHKENVIQKFIDYIGNQVILLTQDEELNGASLRKVRSYVTKEYEFINSDENNTKFDEISEEGVV